MFGKRRVLVIVLAVLAAGSAARRPRHDAAADDPCPRDPGRRAAPSSRSRSGSSGTSSRTSGCRARSRSSPASSASAAASGSSSPGRSSRTSPTTGCSGSRSWCASSRRSPPSPSSRSRRSAPRERLLARRGAALRLARRPPARDQRGAHWGWGSAKTLGLFVRRRRPRRRLGAGRARTRHPLVDMAMMRLRGVWTTNVATLLVGFGMYSAFVLIPQYVQAPTSTGYGFGASVTQAGLYLLPSRCRHRRLQPGRRTALEAWARRCR